jgi:hypothetical protein
MEQEIVKVELSKEVDLKVEFKEGKLCAEVVLDSKLLDGSVVLKLDAVEVVEALKKAIPGVIDDAVLDVVKKMLVGA